MSIDIPSETNGGSPGKRSIWSWMWRAFAVVIVLLIIAYAGFALYVAMLPDPAGETSNGFSENSARPENARGIKTASDRVQRRGVQTAVANDDARLRKDIVGTWERFDEGRRQLTINADGTAQLVYKPNFTMKAKLLWTSRLTVEIRWSVKEGYVDFESISGKPSRAFKVAVKFEGKRKHRRIVELSREKMVLSKDDEDRISHWKRIRPLTAR